MVDRKKNPASPNESLIGRVSLVVLFLLSSQQIARPDNSQNPADGYTVQGKPAKKLAFDAAKLHDEGLLLMRANDNEQAVQKFKAAIELYDGYPEVHHSLGLALAKMGNNDAAIPELKRALELNPNASDTWILLSGFYQAQNKLTEAVSAYNEFLVRFPNHPMVGKVNTSLGFLYAKLGKSDEAINELIIAVEKSPNLPAAWITLGGVYQAKGDLDRAIATYSQYTQRFSAKDDAMYSKISALLQSLSKERDKRNLEKGQDRLLEEARDPGMLEVARKQAENNGSSASNTVSAPGTQDPPETKKDNDDYLSAMMRVGVTRWPRTRIPVPVYITDGSKVDGFRDSMKTILRRSFDDWSKASDGKVTFVFVESADKARLKCYWTNDRSSLQNSSEAGDARVFEDQSYISNAEIWFLTKPLSKSMPLTDNVFRMIALHEVGHALGLSGHTGNPDDVMFYSTTFKDSWRELSGRDSRTIRRLYQSDI